MKHFRCEHGHLFDANDQPNACPYCPDGRPCDGALEQVDAAGRRLPQRQAASS